MLKDVEIYPLLLGRLNNTLYIYILKQNNMKKAILVKFVTTVRITIDGDEPTDVDYEKAIIKASETLTDNEADGITGYVDDLKNPYQEGCEIPYCPKCHHDDHILDDYDFPETMFLCNMCGTEFPKETYEMILKPKEI